MYKNFFRPMLFALPPEAVHQGTLRLLRTAGKLQGIMKVLTRIYKPHPQSSKHLFGLEFLNQVGLAAGYDKDGEAVACLAALGFGHIEVGTVTPRPQPGNPKPRIFRLPEDKALINRMGFPGKGAEYVANQLSRLDKPPGLVLGVNLGKNKDTPLDEAVNDYLFLIEKFAPLADYLVINISSPNTVGLRQLQHQEYLGRLLEKADHQRKMSEGQFGKKLPLLVKLAPDLSDTELSQIVDTVLSIQIDGIIATNTTIARDGIHSPRAAETGGLSGQPLASRSLQVIQQIRRQASDDFPIFGVGGIHSPEDAEAKIKAGADLVQLYTGLIYQGPGLVKQIVEQLDSN
ncbi:MAG: quinone-dependent dihydroorotate dehydrogenase [Chloroflexota bacterium]